MSDLFGKAGMGLLDEVNRPESDGGSFG